MTEAVLQILYFSWIREAVGRDEETLAMPPDVTTVADLIDYLCRADTGYTTAFADRDRVRVAVNQTHVPLTHAVRAGDEIAFFPPVTGGISCV